MSINKFQVQIPFPIPWIIVAKSFLFQNTKNKRKMGGKDKKKKRKPHTKKWVFLWNGFGSAKTRGNDQQNKAAVTDRQWHWLESSKHSAFLLVNIQQNIDYFATNISSRQPWLFHMWPILLIPGDIQPAVLQHV